ncbi:division plane positioning ATPase MipZ [Rickettsiales bacterium]|nr:division plane positioning ATPase MipZ [Rickettsiales bacterium]
MKTSRNGSGPHIIVVGNEKGGCGKTTTSMHMVMSLLYEGYKVSSIDIDSRQRSFSNYLENRRNYIVNHKVNLPFPSHFIINRSTADSVQEAKWDDQQRFLSCLTRASEKGDFVVIDSPGNDTFLSRFVHSYADTIITPINDSFIDMNLLAHIDSETMEVSKPGIYSEIVWEAKKYRALRDKGSIDWIVLRNRLSNLDAHNKRNVALAMKNLSARLGCRVVSGFSERVIYRELFLSGLTLLDVINEKSDIPLKLSHITARQELRDFMQNLHIFSQQDDDFSPKEESKEEISAQEETISA